MKLKIWLPGGGNKVLSVEKDNVSIGRNQDCDIVLAADQFPKVSGLHAEIAIKSGHAWLIHRSRSNATVYRDVAISQPVRLQIGDRFRLGFTGPEFELLESQSIQLPDPTVFAGKAADFLSASVAPPAVLELGPRAVIGRVAGNGNLQLDHPHVSRQHALIRRNESQTVIADLKSSNGTFVNGVRINNPVQLNPGDLVDIGPFALVYDGRRLSGRSRANNIQIDIANVSCVVQDASAKRRIHLLNEVMFSVLPGEFVAVLGPSGSGKSTLLGIISGRQQPFSGNVYLNGRDLHRSFGALKEDLVVVPQTSVVHSSLSVLQTIRYAAELRLPADTAANEIDAKTQEILGIVGLGHRATTRVKQLSGGQLKRLGLGCELVSDPSLLFLDEVTSGLDEQSDGEMMQLFRSLADRGKTLVCVTHNLGHVERYCHKILVLTEGGRVAYFGPPQSALKHFGAAKLPDLYGILATRKAEYWAAAFLNSPDGKATADQPAATTDLSADDTVANRRSLVDAVGRRPLSQTQVLIRRYMAIWWGDLPALAAMMGQAALVTILLCLVFRSIPAADEVGALVTRAAEIRNLLFLVGISCFWMGANNTAKEIVRERAIYQREKNFNLLPEAFWASKVLVLGFIGALQTVMLVAGVQWGCDLPLDLWPMLGIALTVSFLGTNLGLAISANARTEELAVALVPAVIIPQIILAGVVAGLDTLTVWFAKVLTTSFWVQRLFERGLPEIDRLPTQFDPSPQVCWTVLAVQMALFLIVTWYGLRFAKWKSNS
jgi:ABC-type multidrug transport system ATPase subunit/pSer/pThr/pTyr-binding forkhead associated (FHA) protein